MFKSNKMMIAIVLSAALSLVGCSTECVIDNSVDATGLVAKTAVKGVVGAGRLVVKGGKRTAGADLHQCHKKRLGRGDVMLHRPVPVQQPCVTRQAAMQNCRYSKAG